MLYPTELPESIELREGLEPPTTRVTGEVTVIYATGKFVSGAFAAYEKHTGERAKKDGLGASALRCLANRDYAPAPKSEQLPAEPSHSARPWLAEEVTLFFHHRCCVICRLRSTVILYTHRLCASGDSMSSRT